MQWLVDLDIVVFPEVVPTSRTAVHGGFKGTIEAALADVVQALGGDGLIYHFLAADAQKSLFHFVDEFWTLLKKFHGFIPQLDV